MIHWDDLKYLLALEQHGNMIKAAKSLNTNPTTVSRHIKRLSETYQQTLIARTHNGGWQLTEQGQTFARAAQVCQQQIQQLDKPSEVVESTNITVSTVDFIAETILAPRINDLQLRRNQISLTMETSDKNVSLAFGEADLAIRLGRPKQGRLVASKICNLTGCLRCKRPISTSIVRLHCAWVRLLA
jgi:DNA-binding transcriptional LysR family regulator